MKEAELVQRFRSRELLNRSALEELESYVGNILKMDEFQDFYGKCVLLGDELDVPFINRNLHISRNIWQMNRRRLAEMSGMQT